MKSWRQLQGQGGPLLRGVGDDAHQATQRQTLRVQRLLGRQPLSGTIRSSFATRCKMKMVPHEQRRWFCTFPPTSRRRKTNPTHLPSFLWARALLDCLTGLCNAKSPDSHWEVDLETTPTNRSKTPLSNRSLSNQESARGH